jgi:hypothetical protein
MEDGRKMPKIHMIHSLNQQITRLAAILSTPPPRLRPLPPVRPFAKDRATRKPEATMKARVTVMLKTGVLDPQG